MAVSITLEISYPNGVRCISLLLPVSFFALRPDSGLGNSGEKLLRLLLLTRRAYRAVKKVHHDLQKKLQHMGKGNGASAELADFETLETLLQE